MEIIVCVKPVLDRFTPGQIRRRSQEQPGHSPRGNAPGDEPLRCSGRGSGPADQRGEEGRKVTVLTMETPAPTA